MEGVRNPRARQRAFCIAAGPHEHDVGELKELLRTAGVAVSGEMTQRRPEPDPDRYFGRGKLAELKEAIAESGANLVACDDELKPRQERNLEQALDMPVIDRTAIILDIFADHAHSAEGKLQVELAQLEYNLARMRGLWTHLERLGAGRMDGGIGTRGPGESQIETDRRLVRDRLFHTLDPTTRSFEVGGRTYLLTDTVGFIRKLPHALVDAFSATLEEAMGADLIMHLADASVPEDDLHEMLAAVDDVLDEIGAGDRPRLLALNKADLVDEEPRHALSFRFPDAVQVSAVTGDGLDDLHEAIEARFLATLRPMDLLLPYEEGGTLSELHDLAGELERTDTAEGVRIRARVPAAAAPRFERFEENGAGG